MFQQFFVNKHYRLRDSKLAGPSGGLRLVTDETTKNKNRGAVVNRAIKKRGYLHCLRNVTLLPFSKYTEKEYLITFFA